MKCQILTANLDDIEYINFIGVVRYSDCTGLESYIEQLFNSNEKKLKDIAINLEQAEMLDSTALGLLARISIEFDKLKSKKPIIFVQKGELAHILRRVCFDQVFRIITSDSLSSIDASDSSLNSDRNLNFVELATIDADEKEVLKSVISAHKSLAEISEKNEHYYTDISKALK